MNNSINTIIQPYVNKHNQAKSLEYETKPSQNQTELKWVIFEEGPKMNRYKVSRYVGTKGRSLKMS